VVVTLSGEMLYRPVHSWTGLFVSEQSICGGEDALVWNVHGEDEATLTPTPHQSVVLKAPEQP
jgi:hypothetical protein